MPEFDAQRPEPVQIQIPPWSPEGTSYRTLRFLAGATGVVNLLVAVPLIALLSWLEPLNAHGEVILYACLTTAIAGGALLVGALLKATVGMLGWTGLVAAAALVAAFAPMLGTDSGMVVMALWGCPHMLVIALDLACAGYALSKPARLREFIADLKDR